MVKNEKVRTSVETLTSFYLRNSLFRWFESYAFAEPEASH